MRHTMVAVAALAVLASGCSTDAADPDGDPTPTPSASVSEQPSSEPSSEPDAPTGLRELGAARDLGPGYIAGPTPDGDRLFVLAPEPDSDIFGCEGAPFDVLWVVDPETGERSRAIDGPVDDHPFVTDVLATGAPDGRVALLGSCEGFLGSVLVGDLADDGTVTGLAEVPLPPIELVPWSIRWVPGSSDLVAVGAADFDSPGVFVIDSVSGDWVDIDNRPLQAWIPFPDGVVAELQDGTVRFVNPDGSLLTDFPADEVVPSATGLPALAFSYDYTSDPSTGTVSLVTGTGIREILEDDAQGFAGAISADGSVAAWAQSDPVTYDTALVLHDVETGRKVRVDDVWFGGATFVSTGVAYVVEGPDVDADFGDPIVRFRPWQG